MKSLILNCALLVVASLAMSEKSWAQDSADETCRGILASSGGQSRPRTYCERQVTGIRDDLQRRGVDTSRMSNVEVLDRWQLEADANARIRGSDTASPAEHRAQLQEWGVNVQGLSDAQIVDRWNREDEARAVAASRKSRREAEAKELRRLADEDVAEERRAKERRDTDALARQATSSTEGLRRAGEVSRAQGEAALRNFGVDPDALQSDDEEESDAAADAFGQKLYQQMIDNGLAPQCKGKKGDALVDCVDAALGADDQ
jgi:hypothetical protein